MFSVDSLYRHIVTFFCHSSILCWRKNPFVLQLSVDDLTQHGDVYNSNGQGGVLSHLKVGVIMKSFVFSLTAMMYGM